MDNEKTTIEMMEERVQKLLDKLDRQVMDPGERKELIDEIVKLSRAITEAKTAESEAENARQKLNLDSLKNSNENANERERIENEKKEAKKQRWMDFFVKLLTVIVELGVSVGTLAFYHKWMKWGFEFEKTGTFTSTVFRGLFGKFKPGKGV